MGGSIENMCAVYKKNVFTYVPPSPPIELIDCSNFFLNFSSRKFLNIGLDPTYEFNTVIHIITPSRFLNISTDFLKRIYRLMGNILSFILEQPQKHKRSLFLDTDSVTISSMVYQGENILVMESKIQLQDLEWSIFEIIKRKTEIVKPLIIQQINQIASYLKRNTEVVTRTLEDMTNRVKSINNIFITSHVIGFNFSSQLQLYTADHIAKIWLDELEKDEGFYEKPFSPTSFYAIFNEEIPSDIPPMSPSSPNRVDDVNDHPFDSLNIRFIDENDGPYGPQYNITETSNFDVAGPHGPQYNML
ncbi:Uncharacterized protein FWK35_00028889, partial [Aphis craccivora]